MSVEHLSEEQIAMCADAMAMEEYSRITPKVRAHLAECDQCADEVNTTAQIVKKNFSQSLTSALLEAKQQKSNNGWWIGAAAGLILLIGLGYLFKDQIFIQTPEFADTSDSIVNITDSNQVANQDITNPEEQLLDTNKLNQDAQSDESLLAFQSNIELDKLADRFKDANMRGDEIDIITLPEYKTKLENIQLSWKTDEEQYLSVEIFDNKANKIESVLTSSQQFKPKQITRRGVYYWKLINEDFDLLFCGKIVVEER